MVDGTRPQRSLHAPSMISLTHLFFVFSLFFPGAFLAPTQAPLVVPTTRELPRIPSGVLVSLLTAHIPRDSCAARTTRPFSPYHRHTSRRALRDWVFRVVGVPQEETQEGEGAGREIWDTIVRSISPSFPLAPLLTACAAAIVIHLCG